MLWVSDLHAQIDFYSKLFDVKPVFTVSNLAVAQNRVAATFATFSPGTIDFGQFVYQDVVDPEGNVIQLQQRVGN